MRSEWEAYRSKGWWRYYNRHPLHIGNRSCTGNVCRPETETKFPGSEGPAGRAAQARVDTTVGIVRQATLRAAHDSDGAQRSAPTGDPDGLSAVVGHIEFALRSGRAHSTGGWRRGWGWWCGNGRGGAVAIEVAVAV
jgi:hypothetical protein